MGDSIKNKDKNKTIQAIVMSGGGVKGLAYIGVLEYLEKTKTLQNISTFVGCSIGAFACMLIALGYSSFVIKNVMNNYDMSKLNYPSVMCLVNNLGLDNGDRLEQFIKTWLKNADFEQNITLLELHTKTNKTLVVSVTDILSKEAVLIDYHTFPEIPVYLAVKMSMSIPFVYRPVLYLGRYYCDGYLSCNFPVRYFKTEISKPNEILCFHFETEPIKNESIHELEYINNIIKTPMSVIQKMDILYALSKKFKVIAINIPLEFSSLKFELTKEEKSKLYTIGLDSCKILLLEN
jgi:predicted acylesterase/phospholipase RssA